MSWEKSVVGVSFMWWYNGKPMDWTYGSKHLHQRWLCVSHDSEASRWVLVSLRIILSHCEVSVSIVHRGVSVCDSLTSGPLSLGDVGTPFLPVLCSLAVLLQTLLLLTENLCVVNVDHGDAECPVGNRWTKSRRAG